MSESAFPPPLNVDVEVLRMMRIYALAQHTLHIGGSGEFRFYLWGKEYEILVEGGQMTSQAVVKL